MKHIARMIPVAVCASHLGAQGVAAVTEYQTGIDATHYSFTVVLPDSGKRVTINGTVFVRRTRNVDSLWLDLESPMQVSRVTVNGTDSKFVRDQHTVRVALPKWNPQCANPPRGDTAGRCTDHVTIDAAGEPADGLIISKDAKGRWQYFCDHWPNRARNWMPSIDHPSDKATVEWRVHAPSSLKVVANGTLTEESPLPNERGRTITVWKTDRPISPYLMVIAAAPMAKVSLGQTACGLAENRGCVQQDVYESPELAPRTPPGFLSAAAIVEWMSKFVAPFPYEKLAHLQSSTRFGGMENASAIFYADRQFQNMTLADGLVAHETAHQWFGDAVTEGRWSDLWLSEGFATYFAALWTRIPTATRTNTDSAFRATMANIRKTVLEAPEVAARPVIDTTQTDLLELLNANSYQKGGFVLHMLRNELGDSAWIRGIRAYYNAHRHGNALTKDLRTAMETESKRDLGWFFDQWLTRPGYAELGVSWEYDENLTVHVTQTGKFGVYRLTLPIEIEDPNGVVTRTSVDVPASANARLQLPVRVTQRPRRVTFDPRGDLLAILTSR
jgi:aminopeptidase N